MLTEMSRAYPGLANARSGRLMELLRRLPTTRMVCVCVCRRLCLCSSHVRARMQAIIVFLCQIVGRRAPRVARRPTLDGRSIAPGREPCDRLPKSGTPLLPGETSKWGPVFECARRPTSKQAVLTQGATHACLAHNAWVILIVMFALSALAVCSRRSVPDCGVGRCGVPVCLKSRTDEAPRPSVCFEFLFQPVISCVRPLRFCFGVGSARSSPGAEFECCVNMLP